MNQKDSHKEYYLFIFLDWRKPGVRFGWVKLNARGPIYASFIFPKRFSPHHRKDKEYAQYITKKGELSDTKHPVHEYMSSAALQKKKFEGYTDALDIFNVINECDYN